MTWPTRIISNDNHAWLEDDDVDKPTPEAECDMIPIPPGRPSGEITVNLVKTPTLESEFASAAMLAANELLFRYSMVPDYDTDRADAISLAAIIAREHVTLRERLEKAERETERLKSQLPAGMQHCTIECRECPVGHHWLTATNWIEHECPWCQIRTMRSLLRKTEWHPCDDETGCPTGDVYCIECDGGGSLHPGRGHHRIQPTHKPGCLLASVLYNPDGTKKG